MAKLQNGKEHLIKAAILISPAIPIGLELELVFRSSDREVDKKITESDEFKASYIHYEKQRSLFSGKDNSRLLALTSVCHVLLNSNEFLYID